MPGTVLCPRNSQWKNIVPVLYKFTKKITLVNISFMQLGKKELVSHPILRQPFSYNFSILYFTLSYPAHSWFAMSLAVVYLLELPDDSFSEQNTATSTTYQWIGWLEPQDGTSPEACICYCYHLLVNRVNRTTRWYISRSLDYNHSRIIKRYVSVVVLMM